MRRLASAKASTGDDVRLIYWTDGNTVTVLPRLFFIALGVESKINWSKLKWEDRYVKMVIWKQTKRAKNS